MERRANSVYGCMPGVLREVTMEINQLYNVANGVA
jgi:hypothetical protein